MFSRRLDDEPFGRMPNEVERITGHESDCPFRGGGQHPDIFGVHDLDGRHRIRDRPLRSQQLDAVSDLDVLQSPEKAVTVTGDAEIAASVDSGGPLNSRHAPIEIEIVGAIVDRHLNSQFIYVHDGQRRVRLDGQAFLVFANSLLCPQALIRRAQDRGNAARRRTGNRDSLAGGVRERGDAGLPLAFAVESQQEKTANNATPPT